MSNDEEWEFDPQVYTVVANEIERVKKTIKEIKEPEEGVNPKFLYKDKVDENSPAYTARMRLDWELYKESGVDEKDKDTVIDLMFEQVLIDLCDLLEHGDKDDFSNPLYHALDGKKKLGKDLKSLTLKEIVCYKEYKPLKESIEYTLYMLITCEWS